jgi:hypothetical protein
MIVVEEENLNSSKTRPKNDESNMAKLMDVDLDMWCIPTSVLFGVVVRLSTRLFVFISFGKS